MQYQSDEGYLLNGQLGEPIPEATISLVSGDEVVASIEIANESSFELSTSTPGHYIIWIETPTALIELPDFSVGDV